MTGLSLERNEINKSKKKTYSVAFSSHLDILEDRLSLSLRIAPPKKERENKSFVPSILPSFHDDDDETNQTGQDLDETFLSASSNLLDVTSSGIETQTRDTCRN